MATQRVLERPRNGEKHDGRLDALSDQEKRIHELIGEGMERRTQAAAYVARMSAERDHSRN